MIFHDINSCYVLRFHARWKIVWRPAKQVGWRRGRSLLRQVLEQLDAVLVVGDGPIQAWQTQLLGDLLGANSSDMPSARHMALNPAEQPESFAFFDYPWAPGELQALRFANRAVPWRLGPFTSKLAL